MDPKTIFIIAALMMLANGGVLGLMHWDLPRTLRPAAVSWRVATLLHASGSILYVVQGSLPPGFVLPLANGMVMLGFTGYWRALRQFYGAPDTPWLLLPAALAIPGVYWYAAVSPNIAARILIVSVTWLLIIGGCVRTLLAQKRRERALSRRVMSGIFLLVMVFVAVRAIYYVLLGVAPGFSVIDSTWMNMATPALVAVVPVIGTTAFLLMCSERIRRQWERAASTDYLTGLANRRTLSETGEQRFLAQKEGFGLAVIDIDHFKSINDNHGHDIGDVALKHVAAQLEAACREAELPARQGGEEFVVLFDQVDASTAFTAGERLRAAVAARPFAAGSLSLPLTVSIGVAVRCPEDKGLDCLLRRADAALYRAKAEGRNQVQVAA